MPHRIEGHETAPGRRSPRLLPLDATPGLAFLGELERLWAAGDAALPVDPGLPPGRRRALQAELHAGAAVAQGVALCVPTSGTGGRPKGVELEHTALEASVRASLDRIGAGPSDHWLCCLPVHHVAGLAVLLRARASEARLTVHPRFDPAAVGTEREATLVSLVPTMLTRLLDAGVDLRRFRTILLGGAPAPAALLERAEEAGARVVVTYGMTETCGGCVYDEVALDGVEARVGPGGRVELRGPVLFRGYRGREDLTRAALVDGWLRTNDLGRQAADGRLEVLGRADDVIITGGEKVHAGRLAALIETHPAVAGASVVGMQDPDWGQRIVAYVVPAPGPRPTPEALRAFVRAHSPAHEVPKGVVFVDTLPRTSLGKVARPRPSDA